MEDNNLILKHYVLFSDEARLRFCRAVLHLRKPSGPGPALLQDQPRGAQRRPEDHPQVPGQKHRKRIRMKSYEKTFV